MKVNNNFLKTKSGFTLMEVLVSTVLIGILGVLISQSFLTTVRTNTKTEAMKDIKQNGDYALMTITRLIQNAQSITVCGTGVHSLTFVDSNAVSTTINAQTNSGVCRIAVTTTSTTYLTSEDIRLQGATCANNITFTCNPIYGSVPAQVTLSFILEQDTASTKPVDIASQSFVTTVEMRNINP